MRSCRKVLSPDRSQIFFSELSILLTMSSTQDLAVAAVDLRSFLIAWLTYLGDSKREASLSIVLIRSRHLLTSPDTGSGSGSSQYSSSSESSSKTECLR